MRHLLPILAVWIGVCWADAARVGAQSVAPGRKTLPDDALRAMERVELLDHPPLEGLIESEDSAWITMIQIKRLPGQPMHLVIRSDRPPPGGRRGPAGARPAGEVAAGDRAVPQTARPSRPAAWRPSPWNRSTRKGTTISITVEVVLAGQYGRRADHPAAHWCGPNRCLPPIARSFRPAPRRRTPRGWSSSGRWSSTKAFLVRLGLTIRSRACFLADKNLVVAGTELARLASIMAKVNAQNEQLRQQSKELEKRLADRLREVAGRLKQDGLPSNEIARLLTIERRKFDEQNKKLRDDLNRSDREIARIFNQNTRRTFARLYHESFHAYLENYVYPHRDYDVPHWLNEGLAVMFEGGMLEGDTLRVDAPNGEALRNLKEDLHGEQPLPLERLLAAGQGEFVPAGDAAQAAADRYYAHAWGWPTTWPSSNTC